MFISISIYRPFILGMTEKFYMRRFHFSVSSSPFTLASYVFFVYVTLVSARRWKFLAAHLRRGTKYIFRGLQPYCRQIWCCAIVQIILSLDLVQYLCLKTLRCGYRTYHCHQVKRKVLFSKRRVLIFILSTALVEVQNQLLRKHVDLWFIEVLITAVGHSY